MRTGARICAALLFLLPLIASQARPVRAASARSIVVHSVWLSGVGDHDREEEDRFLDCLLAQSSFADFWKGTVKITIGVSRVVDAPAGPTSDEWLASLAERGVLPGPSADVTPVYLVHGRASDLPGGCGQNTVGAIGGRPIGLALVRVQPSCFQGLPSIRGVTQLAQHEIAEVIDQLEGFAACGGDGRCEAQLSCEGGEKTCEALTGLFCTGAPEQSFTGCDGTPVHGWVVQKLSHKSWVGDACEPCATCDFSLIACAGGGTSCAPLSPDPFVRPAPPAGCSRASGTGP